MAFRALTADDGLSQEHVRAITQDAHGFMWFGTAAGLNRYDGFQFRVYRTSPDDSTGLSDDTVLSLHIDRAGQLWVGTETALHRYDQERDCFIRYRNRPGDLGSLAAGPVMAISSDRSGAVWIATSILNRLDAQTGSVERFPVDFGPAGQIWSVLVDREDRPWIAVGTLYRAQAHPDAKFGVYRFDPAERMFRHVPHNPSDPWSPGPSERGAAHLAEGPDGSIWIALFESGVDRYDPETDRFHHYRSRPSDASTSLGEIANLMAFDKSGALWVSATEPPGFILAQRSALNRLDPRSGMVTRYPTDLSDPFGLGDVSIASMHVSREGVLWIGTSGAGLRFADTESKPFGVYRTADFQTSAWGFVRAIYLDEGNRLWLGTPRGLERLDRKTGQVRRYFQDTEGAASQKSGYVQAIRADKSGRIFVSLRPAELFLWDPARDAFRKLTVDRGLSPERGPGEILSLHAAADGSIWVIYDDGDVFRVPNGATTAERMASLSHRFGVIHAVIAGPGDAAWLATNQGIVQYSRTTDSASLLFEGRPGHEGLHDARVDALVESPGLPGVLWLGTRGHGVGRLDIRDGSLRWIRSDDGGLPDNLVYAALNGRDGRVWLSTNDGLAALDPKTEAITAFGVDRGLQAREFNRFAAFSAPDGELFFGGVRGVNYFYPDQAMGNPRPPSSLIAAVRAVNLAASDPDEGTAVIYRFGMPSDVMVLSYEQRHLVFDFVGFHYTNPSYNRYSFKLDGFDSGWHDAIGIQSATYTNLEPGDYTFRVRTASSHGVWDEAGATFAFRIRPPFWKSLWFRILAVLVLAALAFVVQFLFLSAHRARQETLKAEVERRTSELSEALATTAHQAELLREAEEAKTRFFANVAHAFRTPLTLALGPIEDIRKGVYGPISPQISEELEVALRNSRRVGRLVDDLLRVSRLGSGSVRLLVQPVNLSELVRHLEHEFRPWAERERIALTSEVPEWLVVWADEQQLSEVFSNLVSNALKFTSEGGTVTLIVTPDVDPGWVAVSVRDSGVGISKEDLPHLFDRFYRVPNSADSEIAGSGIGLSVAHDLIELHGGTIEVESTPGEGSTFIVRLRTGTDHFDPEVADWLEQGPADSPDDRSAVPAKADEPGDAGMQGDTGEDQPTVLIVEDNHDMRKYIRRRLSGSYRIAEAPDGEAGLGKARRLLPDLILADVMMPGMDGWTLCREVKKDPDLQFVPVILLTARASREDRIRGLETDADAYLTKPFEMAELLATIANLLRKNELVKVKLAELGTDAGGTLRTATDRKGGFSFEESVRNVILRHLENSEFSVEELAREMALSRAHLYRVLMEQKGVGPSEYIFTVRLEKARELIVDTDLSVKDIAAATGFKTVPHFSRRFRDQFGQTASAYRASARGGS